MRESHDSGESLDWKQARSASFPNLKHSTKTISLRLPGADFIEIHGTLDAEEQALYEQRYPQESEAMTGFAERFRTEGREEGLQQGEAAVLLRQMERRFGSGAALRCRDRIERADADTLLVWSERILTAESVEDVIS